MHYSTIFLALASVLLLSVQAAPASPLGKREQASVRARPHARLAAPQLSKRHLAGGSIHYAPQLGKRHQAAGRKSLMLGRLLLTMAEAKK